MPTVGDRRRAKGRLRRESKRRDEDAKGVASVTSAARTWRHCPLRLSTTGVRHAGRKRVKRFLALIVVLVIMLTAIAIPRAVLAASPSNDDFANATLSPAAGFTDRINTAEATLEANETPYCYPISNSVWYKFNGGASGYNVTFDTTGSDYPAQMTLYLSTPDGLALEGCFGVSTPAVFQANPGETWYIQVAGIPDNGTSTSTTTSTTGTTTTGTTTTGTTTGGTTGETTTGTTTTGTTTGTTGGTTTGGTTTGGSVTTASLTTSTTTSGNLVFTVTTQQIVPIDTILTVDARGGTSAAGDIVTISGMITCSRAASLQIVMNVTQVHAKRYVAMTGGYADLSTCGPTAQHWTATLYDTGSIRFGSGGATVDAYAYTNDDHGSGYAEVLGADVKLKY